MAELEKQKTILIIMGNPARERRSFCESLAIAYQLSAEAAGHQVHMIRPAMLDFDPILHEGYAAEQPPEQDIRDAQAKIQQADHLLFVYPMWQFALPALLKGFMERTFTAGFAYDRKAKNPFSAGLLGGKSAHIVQTMGMPALAYRLFYGTRAPKALKNTLALCGISPVQISCFGNIEACDEAVRHDYLVKMQDWGRQGG